MCQVLSSLVEPDAMLLLIFSERKQGMQMLHEEVKPDDTKTHLTFVLCIPAQIRRDAYKAIKKLTE